MTKRLEGLIRATDFYPFLLIQMGTKDTAWHSPECLKREYESLGKMIKNLRAQIVIPSVFPVEGHGLIRERREENSGK